MHQAITFKPKYSVDVDVEYTILVPSGMPQTAACKLVARLIYQPATWREAVRCIAPVLIIDNNNIAVEVGVSISSNTIIKILLSQSVLDVIGNLTTVTFKFPLDIEATKNLVDPDSLPPVICLYPELTEL